MRVYDARALAPAAIAWRLACSMPGHAGASGDGRPSACRMTARGVNRPGNLAIVNGMGGASALGPQCAVQKNWRAPAVYVTGPKRAARALRGACAELRE